MGCFVCCSDNLKQYLVNHARTFIFSTALPPYIGVQTRAALRIAAAADRQRSDLAALGAFLRVKLREAGFDIGSSDTQIVPILLGENERAVLCAALLNDAGCGVRPIRPPSVPAGTARLRVSLSAKLSTSVLARFADALLSVRDREEAPLHALRP